MSCVYYAMNEKTVLALQEKKRGTYIIKIGETNNVMRRAREVFSRDKDLIMKNWECDDNIAYRRVIEANAHLLLENNFYVERKGNDHYIVKNKAELARIEKALDELIEKAITQADAVDRISM